MQAAALLRLKREEELQKQKLKSYENAMEKELDDVIGYVTRINRRKEEGKLPDLDEPALAEWRRKLEELENDRALQTNAKKEELKFQQEALIGKELEHTSFEQRMYNISMQKPEVWRAFKQKEFDRFMQEEQAYNERMQIENKNAFGGMQNRVEELGGAVMPNQQLVGEAMQQDFAEVVYHLIQALQKLREEAAQDDPDAASVSLKTSMTGLPKQQGNRKKAKACEIF